MGTTPDLSVIIVTYRARHFLEQTLQSVRRASEGMTVEVFVVDNDGGDGSPEMISRLFPEVRLIVNDQNVGFSRANNQAIRRARGRYFLILNPDTLLQDDALRTLLTFLDDRPDAGAAGPMILNADGAFAPESRRAFPSPSVALYRLLGLSRLFPRSRRFGRYNLSYLPPDTGCEVDALSGSCMMVRAMALYHSRKETEAALPGVGASYVQGSAGGGAGLLDEDFFMYGEDLDWCYRIQKAGWKLLYTPETRVLHFKGECTPRDEARYVRLFHHAMLLFARKHLSHGRSVLYRGLLHLGMRLNASFAAAAAQTRRLVRRLPVPEPARRALFVGPAPEAERLSLRLAALPAPPVVLVDHLLWERSSAPAHRANVRHLSERIRQHQIQDVIFAGIPTTAAFDLMQRLQALPVTFRWLSGDGSRVIGKGAGWSLSPPQARNRNPARAHVPVPRSSSKVEVNLGS